MIEIKRNEVPEFDFREAVKKPLRIKCVRMNEAFRVETMEGSLEGKAGDWLMVGVHGEMYPVDDEIFRKTYDLCP